MRRAVFRFDPTATRLSALLLASLADLHAADNAPDPVAKFATEHAVINRSYPHGAPTMSDVPYGKHPKQVLHFWKAKTAMPAPLLFFIHGGAWTGGDRMGGLSGMLKRVLDEGISVVSIEYRFLGEAIQDGLTPPVKGPMFDAARALQFVRSKAAEWNIDRQRIVASGNSAGACTALWLAFHDDLADPKSDDPIARESTRLLAVAVSNAQTTLDPQQMREWTPNSDYGGHAFGVVKSINGKPPVLLSGKYSMDFDVFLARRAELLPLIQEYSPYAHVTADDPPAYLSYRAAPAIGQPQSDPTHSANYGVKLQEHCQRSGVPCELVYPGAVNATHAQVPDFVITMLKKKTRQ